MKKLERARLELFHAHRQAYEQLRKYGPNLFEEDGSIITTDCGQVLRRDGRDFILKIIKYFEDEDEPWWYKWCARLKCVLDDYDNRFRTKKPQDSF